MKLLNARISPALNTLIEMVKNSDGAFKVAFSISGVALEQLG